MPVDMTGGHSSGHHIGGGGPPGLWDHHQQSYNSQLHMQAGDQYQQRPSPYTMNGHQMMQPTQDPFNIPLRFTFPQ